MSQSKLFLLTIPDLNKAEKLRQHLNRQLKHIGGNMLIYVGDNRCLLTEAAGRELAIRHYNACFGDLQAALAKRKGVSRVVLIDPDEAQMLIGAKARGLPAFEARRAKDDKPVNQWNLELVGAPAAWDLFDDPESRPWKSVCIGHMDTGYTEHEAFQFKNGYSPVIRVESGADYVDGLLPARDPLDYEGYPGHGTRTGGVLAADHAQKRFLGAAPGVSLIPYRVTRKVIINAPLGDKQARLDAAIHEAVRDRCDVISISLGDNRAARSLGRAVDAAYDAGIIIACAAGNYFGPIVYPALYDRTLCVAGVTRDGHPWCGSCRGRRVDISAPADEVPRPNSYLEDGKTITDAYGTGDGTSYAVVHVAAAAALWLTYRRQEIDESYGNGENAWMRVEAFRKLLK
jgi:subtilisin family serine protease